nr:hypothetical protein BaRGS_017837 [Batillaria attramentaria]
MRVIRATFEKLSDQQKDVAESVEDLQEDLKDLQARYEEELDELEAFSRRDNLRFFGLTETPGETFESCAAKVVECLQGTVPNKVWSEDDIVRAHRVGKKPNFASVAANRDKNAKPRPMIVKFSRWKDKMAILTKARPALKQKRIDVAGDLTQRQHEQIRLHREKGLRAFYKGNKLVDAGPLQQCGNDDTDNFSERRSGINNNNNSQGDREAGSKDRKQGRRSTVNGDGATPRAPVSGQRHHPSPKPPKRGRTPSSPSVEVEAEAERSQA